LGIALWLGSGVAAWILARIIPLRRGRRRWGELAAALVIALLLGVLATALDFGGWNEPDWRAGVFVFFGTLAGVGVVRATSPLSPRAGRGSG
jgi:hypothetical protein